MKAVAHAGGGRFEVVSVPDPVAGPEDLVLRVHSCGICGSDLKAGAAMPPGTVMGHEFCGEVVEVGSDARSAWREGDTAASMPVRSCGRCRWCLTGEVAHCEEAQYLGLGPAPGAFAEYVKVSAALSFRLGAGPGAVAAERGALVEPLAVGLHAVTRAALEPGMSVLIMGGGSVGTAVLVWARRSGAARIVVSDPSPGRRQAVLALGATDAQDPATGDPAERFDVVIECVGGPGMVQSALNLVKTRGRVVVAGVCAEPDPVMHLGALMKEVDIRYAVYYSVQEFGLAAQLLAEGRLETEGLVTGRTGLDGFQDTFSRLSRGDLRGKYLVQPAAAGS